ncbi:MAG: hypothetical protein A3J74_07965 [Elusimicrobia bacterium RIFCSPHIGHO2_02_FULL_57_9]|nr:MAG: hypothetical protein A3J74_07965 [Elusimicrobia bacterium RIFCSPHIGHO2_02_FULL_57_9]
MRYLDPVSLAQLKNLSLELRGLAVEGMVCGRHQSSLKGFSHDFAEHRPYVPGDGLKALDWKVYARQDRFYIREYKAENILTTQVLVDASGSMNFCAAGRPPKWEHACRLAMAMAYLTLAKGDASGLMTFDSEPRQIVSPRASFSHLELMDRALARRGPGGETDLSRVLEQAAARIKRRSLVILISDLLGDPEAIIKVIKAFKARRHELLILQILDPQERDFEYEGSAVFESLEKGAPLFCDAGALRDSYRREFERFLKAYEASFHRCGAAYSPFFTDRPWEHSLGQLLNRWR